MYWVVILSIVFLKLDSGCCINVLEWVQIGGDLDGEVANDEAGYSVSLNADGTRVAVGERFNDDTGSKAGQVRVFDINDTYAWTQVGQDLNGENTNDEAGYSVALSDDGTRLAFGAPYNNGNPGSNSGHVRVYDLSEATLWVQVGADIDGESADDKSGWSVDLSGDGSRVAIGAPYSYDEGTLRGHVRVYMFNGSEWVQLGNDIVGENDYDYFGQSVALNNEGSRLVAGTPDGSINAGHVRVFDYNGTSWVQVGSRLDGEASGDESGKSVDMCGAGTRIAVGAWDNDGNGDDAGHVRVYELNSSSWVQIGGDIDGEAVNDESGISVALNYDGNVVAIGGWLNDGEGKTDSGHVRVYYLNGTTWSQLGGDIDGETSYDYFGFSLAISASGTRIVAGAHYNDGGGSGSGHVRLFDGIGAPTFLPSGVPSSEPSHSPYMSVAPSHIPSSIPSFTPTYSPSRGIKSKSAASFPTDTLQSVGVGFGIVIVMASLTTCYYMRRKESKRRVANVVEVLPVKSRVVESETSLIPPPAKDSKKRQQPVRVAASLSFASKFALSLCDLPTELDVDDFKWFAGDDHNINIFNSLKNKHGFVLRSDLIKSLNLTDVFLTHDWGRELGRDNHARVSKINEGLKKRGLETWFDSDRMRGDIQKQMARGIDNAQCVVVFVTKRYVDKVQGDEDRDNCQIEFMYAANRKGGNRMVAVVMEERMRDTSLWSGPVGMKLGNHLYVDMAGEYDDSKYFEECVDKLHAEIIAIIRKPIRDLM